LFVSPDEFTFRPDRTTTNSSLGLSPDNRVSQFLERSRFLLTANSRAPEITVFGTPRVAIWPIADPRRTSPSGPCRTAFDELIAFCSRLGATNEPYYFQRMDADSTTADWQNIPRNQTLYRYLQALTNKTIPGNAKSLAAKYGDDRDQILTQIFDYIRSTNLYDNNLPLPNSSFITNERNMPLPRRPTGQNAPQFTDDRYILPAYVMRDGDPECWTVGMTKGHGQVAPIKIGNTKGFGRFHTISEVGLHFICTADGFEDRDIPDTVDDPVAPPNYGKGRRSAHRRPLAIHRLFLFELSPQSV
jgi:hypothetical protein